MSPHIDRRTPEHKQRIAEVARRLDDLIELVNDHPFLGHQKLRRALRKVRDRDVFDHLPAPPRWHQTESLALLKSITKTEMASDDDRVATLGEGSIAVWCFPPRSHGTTFPVFIEIRLDGSLHELA